MESPVERAIKAVEESLVGHVDPYSHSLSEYGIAAAVVPIVLRAIRQPNEAMDRAAATCESSYVGDVYTAMIDALLAEVEGQPDISPITAPR